MKDSRGRACPCPSFFINTRAGTSPAPTILAQQSHSFVNRYISDRLISYLVRVEEIKPDDKCTKYFGQLIAKWRKRVPQPIKNKDFPDLQAAVEEWSRKRNKMVHGMAKSVPGANHQDILEFKKEAEFVAMQGERLANSLQNWYKSFKRRESSRSIKSEI